MEGRRVRIFPDATKGGMDAGRLWAEAFRPCADEVQIFNLSGLKRDDGRAVKDLNDCTRIDCESFDKNRELWDICNLDAGGPRVEIASRVRAVNIPLDSVQNTKDNREAEMQSNKEAEKHSNGETEDTQKRRNSEGGGGEKEKHSLCKGQCDVEAIIKGTIPAERGSTQLHIFRLCQRIKRFAAKENVSEGYFVRLIAPAWHRRAQKYLDGDVSVEDVETMILSRLPKVKSIENPFEDALEVLDSTPPVADPELIERPKLERLARLCREMGRRGEFTLSTRQAASAIGAKDASTGMDNLNVLERFKIIECVQKEAPGGKRASRFRYTGP